MADMTPGELRARAGELHRARHPKQGQPRHPERRQVLAEIPYRPGQVMRVEFLEGNRQFVAFRGWVLDPIGGGFPSKEGFTISCDALPHLAMAIADAMERELDALPAWAGPEPRR
jgi:hypothetical protein